MRGLDAFLLALNIATLILLVILLAGHQYVDIEKFKAVTDGMDKNKLLDAISLASQLGRLDLISSLLAIIGVLVGFATFVGYNEIRTRAAKEAREAAVEYLKENLPPMVRREFDAFQAFNLQAGQEPDTKDVADLMKALAKGGGPDANGK